MSDTPKSTSKDEDDIDIYSELPNFKYDENLLKLEGDNKALKTRVTELVRQVESLEIQLKTCEKTNSNYRRNISMLFLSAKREIERKDRTIAELRSRSFQVARRDFPRRSRNEAADGQGISRKLDGEKAKPIPATSEPPTPSQPKKFGYTFTAGNSRSGLYQCKLPAKDNKSKVDDNKVGKDNSIDSNKKTDCSNIGLSNNQKFDSKVSRSISSKSVQDGFSTKEKENKSSFSENNDKIKEDCIVRQGEGNKAERQQIEISLQRKTTHDERETPIIERKSSSTSRSKSPIASNRKRSPRTLERSSPGNSKKRLSINKSRSKSPSASNRRRSPRISDRRKSPVLTDRRKSPSNSDRRRSPRISVRKHASNRSNGSSGRQARSSSVLRRLDHRSRSIRSRSRVQNTLKPRGKRDSVTREVRSRSKIADGASNKLIGCVKVDLGHSEMKNIHTLNLDPVKAVDTVVDGADTNIDASIDISDKNNSPIAVVDGEINVENNAEVTKVSENVDNPATIGSSETKPLNEPIEEVVTNQTTVENEEHLCRPPLIGPWTQFSVRRYKKLHGFSPLKPDNGEKRLVNIKCIEKKNLFDNKIERTVVTEIDGKTTKEIINIELNKTVVSNEILESSDAKTSNKTLNIELDKDTKELESSKSLESSSVTEPSVLIDQSKDLSCNEKNLKLDDELHSGSNKTLSETNAVPIILNSSNDIYPENEVMRFRNVTDTKTINGQVFDSDKDTSPSIVNRELSVENLLPETSNCEKPELLSEKSTDLKLLVGNQGNGDPVIITENITTASASVLLEEFVKQIDGNVSDFGKGCGAAEGENQAEGNEVLSEINFHSTCNSTGNEMPREIEDIGKVNNDQEICSGMEEQLEFNKGVSDNEKTIQESKNVLPPCVDMPLITSKEDGNVVENKTECVDLQLSSGNEVLISLNLEGKKRDDEHSPVKEQEIVESSVVKEVSTTESVSNAFDKSDSPEIGESPIDKSDSKLTVEKPRIIDNISSSLHTFNSALDFSISTTNTNSLNAEINVEQQRQKAQLSASSLQVVNALKKLPKIRENFLQLFGESSNQDNQKELEAETPSSEGHTSKQCSTTTSSKELKSLSCSSSLSSSTSSSSLSSASSSITQEKSSESTIPQVIRLFGINITEEQSPFHASKSASQNSILEDKLEEVSQSKKAEKCLKTITDDKLTFQNKSEVITVESDFVAVVGQVDKNLEKKSIGEVVIESKRISETKLVECSVEEKHCHKEKIVISKEIICEEPVIFPVPTIVVDKVSDVKSNSEKVVSSHKNNVSGDYYSNFTEALRNETNVSTSKTDISLPDFQFESPSRYIMRINNNSVTSHRGLELTESQSITGEDTLTMVRRLAKPLETVSPIKTPSKMRTSRKPRTFVCPDDESVIKNEEEKVEQKMDGREKNAIENENKLVENEKNLDENKLVENEKKLVENENKISEECNKFAKNENKFIENENKLEENENKITENRKGILENENELIGNRNRVVENKNEDKLTGSDKKSDESESKMIEEQPKSVAKEEMKTNLDFIAKKDKVSVSLSSEHFEFKRRRSSRPIVKLKSSSISLLNKQDDVSKSKIANNQQHEQVTTPPKNVKMDDKQDGAKLEKQPTTPSKKDTTQKISPLVSKQDSIVEKQRIHSPQNNPIQEKLPRQLQKKDSISDNNLASPKIAPLLGKRPLIIPRKNTIERTQGFKRRRVVANRFAQNDLIKLGPTKENKKSESSTKNSEQINVEKNRSPTVSTTGLERQQRLSGSSDLKRGTDGTELHAEKQQKVDNSLKVSEKRDNLIEIANDRISSHVRQTNQEKVDLMAASSSKVPNTMRSSKKVDLKTDFCERRSPSEYFNRRSTMIRRHRELRDRKLVRCRSPLVSRRRVDKYIRETRGRNDSRSSRRVAERSERSSILDCDGSIGWKLKLVDVNIKKPVSLFEKLVSKNILEKLDKPRTFVRCNPLELTPPPMEITSHDVRVLADQSNRSNQITSTADCATQSTHHPDTPKSASNAPEPVCSKNISPKPALNKIVIVRRRSNNTPKVLGDSVGTFIKTNSQTNSVNITEEKSPNAIVIRQERSCTTPRKLEDSPRLQTNSTDLAKVTAEKVTSAPKAANENQGNNVRKEVKKGESNSRVGSIRSTRIVKTQLDFRSRLRQSRK